MSKIDLHMHSNYSDDADLPVSELIARCIENGITTLAVTDHNSATSALESVTYRSNSLNVLTGIEIDCTFEGRNFHLLGYGFTPSDDFDLIHRNFSAVQSALVPQKIASLRRLGFYLDEDVLQKLSGGRMPQEEQMGEAILDDERNDGHPLLLPYREGAARGNMPLINFYWDFFGPGKVCYVPVSFAPMAEMVEAITSNGGIPVIAHLGANIKESYEDVLTAMFAIGVKGVEAFSSYHSPELANRLYDFAVSKNAFVTCGSDFHGRNKPKIEVGQCNYTPLQLATIERFLRAAQD